MNVMLGQVYMYMYFVDGAAYTEVCVVCAQLISDLCQTESQNSRSKLAIDSLTALSIFITK